ncbi:MAG: UDP-2,3-diacylglucosamine diphosphatase LpxI [Bryobacterales bacterium]|nr:UDP-2,3-diacylglucosamine diphosphatase LpxI [Bryobacterales bacterium]
MTSAPLARRYAILCGNGRFPILALEEARKLGDDPVAIGILGEAPPEIERLSPICHWVTIAELGKLIDICHKEGCAELMMAGQVKHVSIFSSLTPDWRLARVLFKAATKNTDSLIGGVIDELARENIRVTDSTHLLKPLLAGEGPLTGRKFTSGEEADVRYGRRIALALSGFDVGQSAAICEKACVALEAMEGTDEMLRRAASLAAGRRLTLVKASRRRQHLLFDVPVLGLASIPVLRDTNTTAVAVDAGRTLLLDKEEMLARAREARIAIVGYPPDE